ncbi:MAG: trypsin-like peptidase domain-containing protein, partial [Gammaproteobacteria bacterium]
MNSHIRVKRTLIRAYVGFRFHCSPNPNLALDVAVLRIEGAPGQPVTIAPSLPLQGHAVATIGAPHGWGFSLSAGLVSRYGETAGMFLDQPMMQIAG